VSGETANAYLFDEDYAARFTREWIEIVERDYNHPSIIMWIPVNESWGTPNLRDPQQQYHLKANYMLLKSLDPTPAGKIPRPASPCRIVDRWPAP
jgi:beta-galactosidase/beta-glucuronidase